MTDRQLVDSVLAGHTCCYAELMSRYSAMVLAKAMGVVRCQDLAAEITQQTFVRAYTHLAGWQGSASIGPWLATMAVRLSLNALDEARRRRIDRIDSSLEPDEYRPEHEQQLQQLEQAIGNLPEPDRSIVRLHYYRRQTTADIARALHLTASNVLVRLHRIRQRLKKQFATDENE